jgi:putative transposase
MKYAFIRAHREEFGVRAMCRVLRVHFSGFYAWLKKPLSRRAQEDLRQTELIRQAWTESGKVYGYRKITDDLRDQGERVSSGPIWWQARGGGRKQAGAAVSDLCAGSGLGDGHYLYQNP